MNKKEINFYFRKGEYGWMSNFWRHTQIVDDTLSPTNEHYYQSQKAKNPLIGAWIRFAINPYLAMCAGRSLRKGKELIEDWDEKKVTIMLKGLRAKFKDKELRTRLLATGNATIHEDSPTDMFWGKKGKDMLGKCLMKVREEMFEAIKNNEEEIIRRITEPERYLE